MSHVEMTMTHVTMFLAPMSHVTKPYVTLNLRNGHVALSIVGIKGHNYGTLFVLLLGVGCNSGVGYLHHKVMDQS